MDTETSKQNSNNEEEEETIGPVPTSDMLEPKRKKQKVLMHENLYLEE